jgi:hypothetical protein
MKKKQLKIQIDELNSFVDKLYDNQQKMQSRIASLESFTGLKEGIVYCDSINDRIRNLQKILSNTSYNPKDKREGSITGNVIKYVDEKGGTGVLNLDVLHKTIAELKA